MINIDEFLGLVAGNVRKVFHKKDFLEILATPLVCGVHVWFVTGLGFLDTIKCDV